MLVLLVFAIAVLFGVFAGGAFIAKRYWLSVTFGLLAVLALGSSLVLLAPPEPV